MKNKKIDKIIAMACSFIMILALAVTFIAVPATAGNLLFLAGEERDPVLTDEQIEELRAELQSTYSVNSVQRMNEIIAENEEKSAEYEAALAEIEEIDAELEARVAEFNAYDDVWNNMFADIEDDPEYIAARESGDADLLLDTALRLIGKTHAEYEEYLAELDRMYAVIEELSARRRELELTVLIHRPVYE